MNSLNLRVSTVKTGENVKRNAEMRATLIILPKHYELSEETYCVELRNATTIPDQVAAVKNTFKSLGSDPQSLQFLADLYFYTPLKHPVRNQVLKLLITASRLGTGNISESQIVETLSKTIQRLVEETKAETESSRWNVTVTSLSGCFDNFECGVKALEQSLTIVFPFLCQSVQKYLTELGVLSSPSVRNEYYLNVHNSIRFILACVQEFSKHMKSQHPDQLKQLNVICKQIILDDEVPMDPRSNSGILMAYIEKIFDTYERFIEDVKAIKNPNEIALCVGVINTFDYHDFLRLSADIRDVCSKIDEIANANATVPNILLCAARSLYQISKILLQFDTIAANTTDDAKLILRKLLIFAFCYLEHHMDSVRHICKDLLRNIVALAKKISFDFLLQKIYDACNSERLSLSMKCVVLLQTASVLGAQEILSHCKELFTTLFAENLGRDFIVNNLFEGLMLASHKELPYKEWKALWISYLLKIATANDSRLPDIEILIVKAVKCEPRLVQYIIADERKAIPVSTKLSALWAVRKSGIKMENFNEIMHNFSNNLQLAILSNCDETRIMALRLLVETHKTTELLTKLECEHLLCYIEYNTNCQSPATRQKSLALLFKALIRCELNLLKILKEQKSKEMIFEKPLHLKFLIDFVRILVGNLFQGANFSRRSMSLQLLEQAVRIAINCELNLNEVLPKQTVTALIETLGDSYEANKETAVGILKLIENYSDYRLLDGDEMPNLTVDDIKTLLISVRPLDCLTAAYHLEFYCNKAPLNAFGLHEQTAAYSPIYFSALRWLLHLLTDGLSTALQSITLAAKMNPLYGILFAIKHLLKLLDFQAFAKDIAWRVLIAELIVICKDLTNVVAPIVNSSSPEGHLPNDFSELPAELTAANSLESDDASAATETTGSGENCKILSNKKTKIDLNSLKTTPQMVLLCAWRTVKEVSLILGEIVLRSPIQMSKTSVDFLVTKDQILEIGEHFKQLLSETKHRGAFEQAYVGFSKLCTRLWRVETLDLNCLPMQWLRELIALISRDEQINEKICSTRRSAGVPFMVQALITSELQVGTTKSLHFCMSQLFHLCSNGRDDRSSESRTHALNILRALFRCTDLSDAIGEYVSEGVICAIRSYEADNWSEKNSATLLFAALITRIFGVQRSRDSENLNIRNRMTGRIFFLRYPKLYDFFLDELKRASVLISKREKAHKLHPLLLILSRLYPSALEGTESNLKLSEFIPYISNCSACPEMQTRYLAAKAILALIAKDAVQIAILRKCAEILQFDTDNFKLINLNLLHGQLLQILLLVRSNKPQDTELISDISCTLVTFHEKTNIKNAVILKAMLDIFIEILNCIKTFTLLSQETIQNLLYFSTQKHLFAAELSYYYPVFRKSFFLYNLHMLRLTLPFGALVDYMLKPPLTHQSVYLEQAETCMNIMLLILLRLRTDNEELAEYELTTGEIDFMRSLSDDTLNSLCTELKQSKALHATLKDIVKKPIFYPECAMKAYAILSLLDNFDFTLSNLIKESKNHPGDVKSPLTLCVERLVLKQGVEFKISQLCLEYLTEIAQPWNPDCLRLKASKIMSHIAVHYRKALEKKNLAFIKAFISLMLSLLMDDDYEIRDNAAKTVLSILPEYIGLENSVSTMAQRLFLQHTADILVAIKADDNYILDIFKIITETQALASILDEGAGSQNSNSNTSSVDLDIFNKDETNVFAEPLKAVADSIVIFKNTFSKRTKVIKTVNNYKVC